MIFLQTRAFTFFISLHLMIFEISYFEQDPSEKRHYSVSIETQPTLFKPGVVHLSNYGSKYAVQVPSLKYLQVTLSLSIYAQDLGLTSINSLQVIKPTLTRLYSHLPLAQMVGYLRTLMQANRFIPFLVFTYTSSLFLTKISVVSEKFSQFKVVELCWHFKFDVLIEAQTFGDTDIY